VNAGCAPAICEVERYRFEPSLLSFEERLITRPTVSNFAMLAAANYRRSGYVPQHAPSLPFGGLASVSGR